MDGPFPDNLIAGIEKFFESEATRPPGLDIYPEVFESDTFFPLQRKRELAQMMRIARTVMPTTVMEIGADKGGGLYHWCKCLPTVKRVIACEIRGTPYSALFEKHFPGIKFLWLPESSYATATVAKVCKFLLGTKIDCLFLDGDKSNFFRDFTIYQHLMAHQGLIFVHDIEDPAPSEAFQMMCRNVLTHGKIIDRQDSMDALDRQDRDIPATTPYEDWLRYWGGRSCCVGVLYMESRK